MRSFHESARTLRAARRRTGVEAVERIGSLRPDFLFLDVQMPDRDGFAVLEALRDDVPRGVVFMTAHDEHALRAFEVRRASASPVTEMVVGGRRSRPAFGCTRLDVHAARGSPLQVNVRGGCRVIPVSQPFRSNLSRATLPMVKNSSLAVIAAALSLGATPIAAQVSTTLDSATIAGFPWRPVGPVNMGGRITDKIGRA